MTNTQQNQSLDQATVKKNRLQLLLLFGIAFIPMFLAYFMLKTDSLIPDSQTNNGQLISPPLDISTLIILNQEGEIYSTETWPNKWVMVVPSSEQCEQQCQDNLAKIQLIHEAQTKEYDRIERIYIASSNSLEKPNVNNIGQQFPKTTIAFTDQTKLTSYLSSVTNNINPITHHYIFLVDPLGNIMMYYTPEHTAKDILDDIKRLLRISNIG